MRLGEEHHRKKDLPQRRVVWRWFGAFPGAFGLGRAQPQCRGTSPCEQRAPGKCSVPRPGSPVPTRSFPVTGPQPLSSLRRAGNRASRSMRVARGSASWLSSHGRGLGPRDALKKATEWPKGSQAPCGVWRADSGLLSRPCRKRRPSSRDDGGVSWADDARGWQCPFVLCLHPQGCLRRGVRVTQQGGEMEGETGERFLQA